MNQPLLDWELIESKKFEGYKYNIFKVENAEHKVYYRGFVMAHGGDFWLENDNHESLRSGLMLLGQQHS